ncbi:MAG TPA: alpha/beta hydrolase [Thermomicrobiales bacterium]|nr:alpha/beta hydrolase [Thermomicrobiales bacterium]
MITTSTSDAASASMPTPMQPPVHHRRRTVDGIELFYREAGDPAAPAIVLLHGFPTSSYMFRNLIPQLARTYHVIAPDYPGFGHSAMPDPSTFPYTFDGLTGIVRGLLDTLGVDRFAIYVQDYGAPVGFRLATAQPERVWAIVSQNGNAYDEGLTPFWDVLRAYWADPSPANAAPLRGFVERDALIWQYTHGVRDVSRVSPDTWVLDEAHLRQPGNVEIQLALFLDYGTNPGLYAAWQASFRAHQPPLLAVWGEHDQIFGPDGARAFARDLPHAEIHLLDTGHFALEEEGDAIAALMTDFLARHDGRSMRETM